MRAFKTEEIAGICHEANRAYCATLGDNSQVRWAEAPDEIKKSAIAGVEFLQANKHATLNALHDNWLVDKTKAGWVHGEVKDAQAKTHPCIKPFNQLPAEQQHKDRIFITIVRGMEHVHTMLSVIPEDAHSSLLGVLDEVIAGEF